jgi:hypothetical protein
VEKRDFAPTASKTPYLRTLNPWQTVFVRAFSSQEDEGAHALLFNLGWKKFSDSSGECALGIFICSEDERPGAVGYIETPANKRRGFDASCLHSPQTIILDYKPAFDTDFCLKTKRAGWSWIYMFRYDALFQGGYARTPFLPAPCTHTCFLQYVSSLRKARGKSRRESARRDSSGNNERLLHDSAK